MTVKELILQLMNCNQNANVKIHSADIDGYFDGGDEIGSVIEVEGTAFLTYNPDKIRKYFDYITKYIKEEIDPALAAQQKRIADICKGLS